MLEEAQRFQVFQLFAYGQDVAQIAAFNEFHHDEILATGHIMTDIQYFNDSRVPEGKSDFALTLKKIDALLIFTPAAAKDFESDHPAGPGVLRAENATKAPGCDLVENPVAPQEKAVGVSL